VIQLSRVTTRAIRVLAMGAIVGGVLAPGAAFAASYPNGGTPPSSVDPATHVEAATATQPGSSSLPFTGGDVAGLAAVGGGAVIIGGLLAHRARRARA
jgi:hypothetical protein